jgi:hypothetical protein
LHWAGKGTHTTEPISPSQNVPGAQDTPRSPGHGTPVEAEPPSISDASIKHVAGKGMAGQTQRLARQKGTIALPQPSVPQLNVGSG